MFGDKEGILQNERFRNLISEILEITRGKKVILLSLVFSILSS